jgi:hypothetical protein
LLKFPSFTSDITVVARDNPAVSTTEMFADDTAKTTVMSKSKVFVDGSFSFNANERNVTVSVMFVMMTSPGLTLASPSSRLMDSYIACVNAACSFSTNDATVILAEPPRVAVVNVDVVGCNVGTDFGCPDGCPDG